MSFSLYCVLATDWGSEEEWTFLITAVGIFMRRYLIENHQ